MYHIAILLLNVADERQLDLIVAQEDVRAPSLRGMLLDMKLTPCRAAALPFRWSVAPRSWTCRRLQAIVLLMLMVPMIALAQNGGWDSIRINGTYLRLGMKQSEALARLAETSTLKKYGDTIGHWCVQPKDFAGLPWDCASVGFLDDKLYTATVELDTATDTTAANLLNRLYMVVLEAEKSGVRVEIHTQPEAEYDMLKMPQRGRTLSVFIGRKEYSIRIQQPVGVPGPSFTTLSESIYQPQTPVPPVQK